MSDTGSGQVRVDDGSTDLQAISRIVRQIVERLDVCKLVKVIAVHPGQGSPPAAGTVDVQLLVNQVDGNFFGVQHGTVFGLPYLRLQAGPWAIVADPAKNDIGIVIVCDRDISAAAKNVGQQVNPGSRRRYNVADGIYVGGIFNSVPAATIWLKSDGTFAITDQPGNVIQSSSSGIAITGNVKVTGTLEATKLQTDDSGLTVTGTITATGKITGSDFSDGSVTSYRVHTHGGVTTGAGLTGTPTPGT
jgi:hypothetical protein